MSIGNAFLNDNAALPKSSFDACSFLDKACAHVQCGLIYMDRFKNNKALSCYFCNEKQFFAATHAYGDNLSIDTTRCANAHESISNCKCHNVVLNVSNHCV